MASSKKAPPAIKLAQPQTFAPPSSFETAPSSSFDDVVQPSSVEAVQPPSFEADQPSSFEAIAPETFEASAPHSFEAPHSVEAPVIEEAPTAPAVEVPAPVEATIDVVETEVAKVAEAPAAAAQDLRDNVRSMVEKGIVETRARYARAKSAAEEASAAFEASYGAARDGIVEFNVKAVEVIKTGADANFDLLKSLAGAPSMSEWVRLSTEFARKRFDDAGAESKNLAALARKVAEKTIEPIKAQVVKSLKIAV